MFSRRGTTNTSIHQANDEAEGSWERYTVQRQTTKSRVSRVLNGGGAKGHLCASYSSESESETNDDHLGRSRTLSRLSHFSETDDDEEGFPYKVKGGMPQVWDWISKGLNQISLWMYWLIVLSFVFEKWLLNVKPRSRRTDSRSRSTVPIHRCQPGPDTSLALVRRGAQIARLESTTLWKVLGVVLLLTALPVLLYLADIDIIGRLGNGLTALGTFVAYESSPHAEDAISSEDIQPEKLKFNQKWSEHGLESQKAARQNYMPEDDLNYMLTQLEPRILNIIDRQLQTMESEWKKDLSQAMPQVSDPYPKVISDIELEVTKKVCKELEEYVAVWDSRLQPPLVASKSHEVLTADLESKLSSNLNKKIYSVEKELEIRLDQLLEEQNRVRDSIFEGLKSELHDYVSTLIKSAGKGEAEEKNHAVNADPDVDAKIRAAITKYDADKTGRADLALESGGGAIVSTRCTKKSSYMGSQLLIWNIPIWYPSNSPRKVIQGGTMPGDCWSFDGAEGFLVIKLVGPSTVTGFTLEHLPKQLSPHGHIESAPKKFQVVGHLDYNDVENEFMFGTYEYLDNGVSMQYFPVQNVNETYFPYVELKILSNHGNVAFTCLYRFRVHGRLQPLQLL